MDSSRRARIARAAGVLGLAAASIVTVVAAPQSAAAAGGPIGTYAESICPPATPGYASCFAMRLVGRAPAPRAHPKGVRPKYTTGPVGGYTPATIASAYGVSASTTTTQTVAIVDAYRDPNILADLNVFNAKYGLAAETTTSFRVLSQTGAVATSVPLDTTGWSIEQALDVQAVRGLCNKCKILLVEATSPSDADLAAAENLAAANASIVSNSFGLAESQSSGNASYVAAFNHPGKAILASTGDDGWYDFDYMNRTSDRGVSTNSPSVPASLSTVIAVAGTALYLNADGTRASEDVWNENGPFDQFGSSLSTRLGASGGGCSTVITAQPWQQQVAGYPTLGCGTKRSTTDIAAVADPFTGYDIYSSYSYGVNASTGWQTIGGTSLSSPLVAAMIGLAGGPQGVKYPALTLYGHYKSARATYDVTVGGTGACSTGTPQSCAVVYGTNPNTYYSGGQLIDCAFGAGTTATVLANRYQCYANKGYDGVSGVGTPNGITTFKAMKPTASIAAPGTVTHNVTKRFDGSRSVDPFPGGTIVKWAWNFGDRHAGSGSKPAHKYATKGKTYTVLLTVTDSYGFTGSTTRRVVVR